jgi:hypothetical protein
MTYAADSVDSMVSTESYCIADYADAKGDGAYKGPCENGLPQGSGEVTYRDGARLNAAFVAGKAGGEVVYHAADGSVYEGSWQQGKRHGQGTYTWAQGSRYEGEWSDDRRHGEGVYSWFNGNRFVGNFKNNKRYNGSYYTSNGHVYKCRLGRCK